ncbi:MAG: LysE family translocator [Paracoccaceae bacterium]
MLSILPETLISFTVASILIEITPGPNMAYLAVLAATEGRRHGFAAVAGVALGLLIIGLLAAFGVAALISSSPILFGLLRWSGVAYLVWLAIEAWRPERGEENEFAASDARYFRRGLIVNLLNPKAGVFYIAMVPGFVNPTGPILAQTVFLSVLFVGIATAIHALIVALAGAAQPFLSNPQHRQTVRRIMAAALFAIAIWFAWSTR